jgi:hypothetical protein
MRAHIEKSESSQINNLRMYFKVLEKQEQDKTQISRWKKYGAQDAEFSPILQMLCFIFFHNGAQFPLKICCLSINP